MCVAPGRLLRRPRHGTRLFGPARRSYKPECARGIRITAERCIAIAIRRQNARRGVRHEPGPVLRHVRGHGSAADERAIPAPRERTDRVRPGSTRLPWGSMVGRLEPKWRSGSSGPFLPVSAAAAGTVRTLTADLPGATACTVDFGASRTDA